MQLSNRIIKKPYISPARQKIALINQGKTAEKEFFAPKKMGAAIFLEEQASNILNQAKKEAEKLLVEGRVKAQEMLVQAKKEGFKTGYQESLEKATFEAEKIRQNAFDLLDQAKKIRQETIRNLEKEIINLSCEIAEKILNTQLTLAPEVVIQIAKKAVNLLSDKEQVNLLVNPKELEIFQACQEEILKSLPAGTKLNILTDAAVKPGGLKIRTNQEEVDVTLDGRWEVLKKILAKG